jgi:transposase
MNHDLFVGIDISKYKHDIAIINKQKKVLVKPFVITDDSAGYQYLLQKLKLLIQQHQTRQFYIGFEATGDYWKNIYYFLKQQSIPVSIAVLNPVQTRAWAKSELRRAKTDAVDAKNIAFFMLEKRPKPFHKTTAVFDAIKDIDKQIYQFKKLHTMAVNKLRIELTKVAPEIEKAFPKIQGKQLLALLAQFPTAELIQQASPIQLKSVCYGEKNWHLSERFIKSIKQLIQHSIAYKTGQGAGVIVQALIRTIKLFQQEIEALKKQLNELYQNINEHDSLLATIPGVSKELAIILEAYINDINRFPNVKKFIAYFGMNPTVCCSGKFIGKSYLQKKGQSIVRQKLFLITLCMLSRKVVPVYPFYKRLIENGKPKLVAIGAAMRKLLTIIFYMMKNNQPFKF